MTSLGLPGLSSQSVSGFVCPFSAKADRRIDAGVLVIEGLETAQRNALYSAGLATRRSLRFHSPSLRFIELLGRNSVCGGLWAAILLVTKPNKAQ